MPFQNARAQWEDKTVAMYKEYVAVNCHLRGFRKQRERESLPFTQVLMAGTSINNVKKEEYHCRPARKMYRGKPIRVSVRSKNTELTERVIVKYSAATNKKLSLSNRNNTTLYITVKVETIVWPEVKL